MSLELAERMHDSPTGEYATLIEDLKAIVTEKQFLARWTLIEMYHEVGEHLTQTSLHDVSIDKIATDSGLSLRTLQRCVQFYTKYPDLDLLPGGKATSWFKVCNELLPETKRIKEESTEEWIVCPRCKGTGQVQK